MSQKAPLPDFVLRGNDAPVTCLCFLSAHSNILVSGNQNGTVTLWDLVTRRPVTLTQSHQGHTVLAVVEWEDGCIMSQGRDGCIHSWCYDGENLTKIDTISFNHAGFCAMVVLKLHGAPHVACPDDNKSSVSLLNLTNKTTSGTLSPLDDSKGMPMQIKCVNDTPSEPVHLIIGYESGCICLWDAETQTVLSSLSVHPESVMSLDYHPELNRGVSGSVSEELCSWSIVKQDSHLITLSGLNSVTVTNPGVGCVRFRDDGKLLATGGWDYRIRLFSGRKLKPLAVLSCHTGSIQAIAFSSDNVFAAASKDKTISLWSVYK